MRNTSACHRCCMVMALIQKLTIQQQKISLILTVPILVNLCRENLKGN